jgi:hypothetical protein
MLLLLMLADTLLLLGSEVGCTADGAAWTATCTQHKQAAATATINAA